MPTYTELLLLCEQLEQACIALEMELEQERAKSAEYLDNWVTQQGDVFPLIASLAGEIQMYKFPKSVKFAVVLDATSVGKSLSWEIKSKCGSLLAKGNAGSENTAKSDAWHALEEMGLVTDGIDL